MKISHRWVQGMSALEGSVLTQGRGGVGSGPVVPIANAIHFLDPYTLTDTVGSMTFFVPSRMSEGWTKLADDSWIALASGVRRCWDSDWSGSVWSRPTGEATEDHFGVTWSTESGLLLEPVRTNLVPYSRDFSDASWNATATVSSGTGIDGTTQSITLTDTSASVSESVSYSLAGSGYRFVGFAMLIKIDPGASHYAHIHLENDDGTAAYAKVAVDIATGDVTLTGLAAYQNATYSGITGTVHSDWVHVTGSIYVRSDNSSFTLTVYPSYSLDGSTQDVTISGVSTTVDQVFFGQDSSLNAGQSCAPITTSGASSATDDDPYVQVASGGATGQVNKTLFLEMRGLGVNWKGASTTGPFNSGGAVIRTYPGIHNTINSSPGYAEAATLTVGAESVVIPRTVPFLAGERVLYAMICYSDGTMQAGAVNRDSDNVWSWTAVAATPTTVELDDLLLAAVYISKVPTCLTNFCVVDKALTPAQIEEEFA